MLETCDKTKVSVKCRGRADDDVHEAASSSSTGGTPRIRAGAWCAGRCRPGQAGARGQPVPSRRRDTAAMANAQGQLFNAAHAEQIGADLKRARDVDLSLERDYFGFFS